jgi:hypothetical protein
MRLYDDDTKILVAETAQIKLWEFTQSDKEGESSELITAL